MPLGDLDFGVGYENHTSYPAPGQIILYPGGISETEILLAYGGVHFASKMGQLAGNHFITLTSGLDEPAGARQDRAVEGRAEDPVRGGLEWLTPAIPAISAATAATRPIRAGPTARGSRCSSWSTSKRAARTTSCTAIPPRKPFCPTCSARSPGRDSATPISNRCSNTARAPASGGCGAMFTERKLPADGVRRRDRAAAQSRHRRGHERGRLGHRQPQPEMGRAQGYAGGGGARRRSRRRSAFTPR